MGVDEIHLVKKQKFITVVSNLNAAEPVWFGQDRKKDTLGACPRIPPSRQLRLDWVSFSDLAFGCDATGSRDQSSPQRSGMKSTTIPLVSWALQHSFRGFMHSTCGASSKCCA
jgi:hypothetical protein